MNIIYKLYLVRHRRHVEQVQLNYDWPIKLLGVMISIVVSISLYRVNLDAFYFKGPTLTPPRPVDRFQKTFRVYKVDLGNESRKVNEAQIQGQL